MLRPSLFRLLPALTVALLATTAPARAEGQITEAAVQAFYKASVDAYRLPFPDYMKAADEMTAENFQSVANVSVSMAGQKPVQQTERMNKQQSLDSSAKSYATMKTATVNYKITAITIAPDGKSANVSDTVDLRGMSMQVAPGQTAVMDGMGACNDVVALSPQGKLQIAKSNCNMRMIVTPKL